MTLYRKLVVDREKIHEEISAILEKHAVYDSESQRIIFTEEKPILSGKQRVLLALLGFSIAHQLGLRENDAAERKEISQNSELKPDATGARMKDLRDDRLSEHTPNGDHLTINGLLECEKILSNLAEGGMKADTD